MIICQVTEIIKTITDVAKMRIRHSLCNQRSMNIDLDTTRVHTHGHPNELCKMCDSDVGVRYVSTTGHV
jgi:hypothetical protein